MDSLIKRASFLRCDQMVAILFRGHLFYVPLVTMMIVLVDASLHKVSNVVR